jgi:hypothetical protein
VTRARSIHSAAALRQVSRSISDIRTSLTPEPQTTSFDICSGGKTPEVRVGRQDPLFVGALVGRQRLMG